MLRYVAIAFMLVNHIVGPPPPLRLNIDCSDERASKYDSLLRSSDCSFCSLIHNVLPKAVRDGKFLLLQPDTDQEGFSDTQVPMAIAPPKGFIPKLGLTKLKVPKLGLPKLNVPKLQPRVGNTLKAPKVGGPITYTRVRLRDEEEDSSAERMERLKKGVQKMLHFVKVLGQIDQYLSERVRIVVDKVSKTFAE